MSDCPDAAEPPDSAPMTSVFDRITDAVFVLDEEFAFTYLNTQAENLLDADAETVLGEQIWEVYPEAEETAFSNAVHEAFETQQSVETELYCDPREIWISVRIYPSENDLAVYCRDITAKKDHKHELDFRTALLEAQTETTIDGHLVVDRDRNIIYYNQRFADIWGIPEEILRKRSDERVLEYVLDMLADPDEYLAKVEDLYENPYEESRDEIRLADGRWLDRFSAPVVGENGTHYGRLWTFRDITDRKERERRLSTVLDNVPGMVYRCRNEPGWPMEFVSDGCRALTGYDPEELEAGELSYGADIVLEDDREDLWEAAQHGLEEDGSFLVTYRIRTADENVRWVRERGHWVAGEARTEDVLEGVVIDVTERKRLEAELDEILGRVTDAFYALDTDWRFTHANERARELIDFEGGGLVGKHLWETFEWAADSKVRDEYERAMETQESTSFELYYPDPLEAWFEVHAYPSETGLSVYFRDITERKEREQQLRAEHELIERIVETSPIGIITLDADGSLDIVNNRVEEILGYSKADLEELVGDIEELDPIGPAGKPIADDELPSTRVLEGETIYDVEVGVKGGDDERVWLSVSGTPLRTTAEAQTGAMLAFTEITDRKEYKQRLEESNERLEQFAYAVSHDLQEPLRMITSYLQLLEDRYGDAFDEDGQEFLEFAVDGAERMREMIEGLLAYSRVETQGDPFEPVDLDTALADALTDLQLEIEESDAEITTESLPRVEGDPDQLRQVFQNLVSNAIKYSGDSPPRVHITAEPTGAEWTISVADEGIGIDTDATDRIFEVFQRLHTHDEHAGTGVGLALCRRIVERHNGEIWVESEPGEGATFFFTLPAASDNDT